MDSQNVTLSISWTLCLYVSCAEQCRNLDNMIRALLQVWYTCFRLNPKICLAKLWHSELHLLDSILNFEFVESRSYLNVVTWTSLFSKLKLWLEKKKITFFPRGTSKLKLLLAKMKLYFDFQVMVCYNNDGSIVKLHPPLCWWVVQFLHQRPFAPVVLHCIYQNDLVSLALITVLSRFLKHVVFKVVFSGPPKKFDLGGVFWDIFTSTGR